MKRPFLLPLLTASSLLLASPVLAGGDGSAGGNSGFSPAGGSALTSIGTSSFDAATSGSQVVVPAATYAAALAQALVNAGLTQATADGIQALLLNQTFNGITPLQAGANLTSQLQAAGASAAQAPALVEALGQLGSSPSLANLKSAVSAFNAMVNSADGPALQSLATTITPIRAYLVTVIENVQITS